MVFCIHEKFSAGFAPGDKAMMMREKRYVAIPKSFIIFVVYSGLLYRIVTYVSFNTIVTGLVLIVGIVMTLYAFFKSIESQVA